MKKLGLTVAAVAVAALVGLPPVVGGLTESQVAARVAALDAHPMLTASVIEHDRGWFSSTAKIELGIDPGYAAQLQATDDSAPALPEESIRIAVDLAHGPVAIGNGAHLGWSSFVARLDPEEPDNAALLDRLGIPYLFEFRGRTSFGGALAFDADMPAIAADEPDGEIDFSGAALKGSLRGRDLDWALEAGSLRLTEGNGRFVAEGIDGDGDIEIHSQYVVTGRAALGVEGMQAIGPFGEPVLEMAAVDVDAGWELDSNGELMHGSITYSVGSLAAADVDIADATFGMRVGNMDVAAMEAYYEAAALPAPELAAEINGIVQRILARSPNLTLEPIRFLWGGEPFDGRVSLEIVDAALPPAALIDLSNPLPLLAALRAQAQATLSKTLAQDIARQVVSTQLAMMGGAGGMPPDQIEYMAGAQAGLMLVTLVGQGYLADNGETYSTNVEYGNGTLTINGNELPLPIP